MTNDRFDHEADPYGGDRPVHPNLSLSTDDAKSYRIFRVPDHATLSRIRYRHDPEYHEAINVAYRWFDDTDGPEAVFDAYAGRRIKITRNLLDGEYYDGDVEPSVGIVTDDRRVDHLLDWADDVPSAYADHDVPEWLDDVLHAEADPHASVVDAADYHLDLGVSTHTKTAIDEARERFEEGEVSRAEFYAFAAELIDADPVEAPSSDVEPGGNDPKTPTEEAQFVDMAWRDVARGILYFAVVLMLIAGAIHFFGV